MNLPLYQVDAFTSRLFSGNPAAVCPLEAWIEDRILQAVAAENNLSETAFFVKQGSRYEIRWFTPTSEVDLCGHATLASAYVILRFLEKDLDVVEFDTRERGALSVRREGDRLTLDFPAMVPEPCEAPEGLLEGLGGRAVSVLRSRDYLVRYADERSVRDLSPDMNLLSRAECVGIIATAPGDDVDFVSRFFAPRMGVPEDPVTGSAHCTLTPYWARELHREQLHALQVSRRGGELFCRALGDRVKISGEAVLYLEGTIRC
jgi:PhzF family phenazine biosynthesis protein